MRSGPTPEAFRDTDSLARAFLRAAAPVLRRHFPTDRLATDLVGELYIRLREMLLDARGVSATAEEVPGLLDEVAMTAYLVVTTDSAEGPESPKLLLALRRAVGSGFDTWRAVRRGRSRD